MLLDARPILITPDRRHKLACDRRAQWPLPGPAALPTIRAVCGLPQEVGP
jgi:hypothetical protein